MISYVRLPRYVWPVLYFLVVSIFVIFHFLSAVFAEDVASLNAESSEKIHITADSLVSDSNAKFAEFIGNIEASQGDFVINSDSLKIYYKGDLKDKTAARSSESIEKIVAIGNVHIKSKEMSADTQQADYDTDTMIIVLSGEGSKVFDQKNFVTGSKITVYRKEGKTRVEGDKNKRVTAVFYPRGKDTPTKEGVKEHAAAQHEIIPSSEKEFIKETKPEKQVLHLKEEVIAEKEKLDDKAKPKPASRMVVSGNLKKSMGVTIFEDKTVYGAMGFNNTLSKNLTENIKKEYPDIFFLKTGDTNYPSSFIKLPRLASGNVDMNKLCETGRQLGLTTILTGSVTDITIYDESRRGILFWKKTLPEISMTVRIELFDTETGTKLFDESYTLKQDSDKNGIELAKSGKIDEVFLKEAIKYFTSSPRKIISNIMVEQKWKGYISSVSGSNASVSSGRNMGVASGMVFDVFGNSIINGLENQKFMIPGPKIGEVKITNVFDNSSEALVISGNALKEGFAIKSK